MKTQTCSGSVDTALEYHYAYRALSGSNVPRAGVHGSFRSEDNSTESDGLSPFRLTKKKQRGILTHSRIFPDRHLTVEPANPGPRIESSLQDFTPNGGIPQAPAKILSQFNRTKWGLWDIRGDEKEEGPIYNYARWLSTPIFALTIYKAFNASLRRLQNKETVNSEPWDNNIVYALKGNKEQLARYCGLDESIGNFADRDGEMMSGVWTRVIIAMLVAIWVQWGTTGPAILIACTEFSHPTGNVA